MFCRRHVSFHVFGVFDVINFCCVSFVVFDCFISMSLNLFVVSDVVFHVFYCIRMSFVAFICLLIHLIRPTCIFRCNIFSSGCRRLFGFATFREYSDAEEAYLTLDLTEFRGRRLNIQFAKSSIASEDEVRMRLEKTQFTTEVNSSRRKNNKRHTCIKFL